MMKKRVTIIIIDLALALIGLAAHSIVAFFSWLLPQCPVKEMGFLCPACGGTRCFYNFFSCNFSAAFSLNAFLFLTTLYVLALLILWNLSWLFELRFANKALRYLMDYRVFIGWGVGMALFCLIRNLI